MKKILPIILTLLVTSFAFPSEAKAATQIRSVSAAYSYLSGASLSYVGGAADYTVLNSDDADTSYARIQYSPPYYVTVNYPMENFVAATSINSVTLYIKARKLATYANIRPEVRISSTNYQAPTQSLVGTSYATYSYTWSTDPSTGLAWSQAGVNAADFGFTANALSPNYPDIRVTYMYIEIDYNLDPPTATTAAATNIGVNSATLRGVVSDDGGDTITDYGFVWDTTSRADPGNTAPTASAYANSWENGSGVAEGTYYNHPTGAGLAADTIYYFRTAAENSQGWAYGDEESFETIGTPIGNTTAATNVTSTTARINGVVSDSNGQSCDVRFGYGTTSQTAGTFNNYDTLTAWVENTYGSGSYPYVDVTSLAVSTTYYYRVQIKNDAGTVTGATEFSFTTESGVYAPTDLTAIPTATTVSLKWVKGTGAATTLVRYSTGGYPSATSEGTLAYLGSGNSIQVEDLDVGTNHYFSAWGLTSGTYSASYTTVLATTLAYEAAETDLETPPSTPLWVQTPDSSKVQNIPFVSDLVDVNESTLGVPNSTIWYVLWVILSVGLGIVLYNRGGHNLPLSLGITAFSFGAGAYLGLQALWIMFIVCVIGVAFMLVGNRY